MTRSRLRLKALGVCALAFSLMAVWAGAAQAENTGGSWTYKEKGTETLRAFEEKLPESEIGTEVDVTLILHSEALEGAKVLYECKAFKAAPGSKIKPNGVILGKLVFTACAAFLEGVKSTPCTPKEGKITTNLIKAQMLLHKLWIFTDKILVAEGETEAGGAANFASIESTALCALGIKVPVGGKFAIESPDLTTHEIEHLVKEFSSLTHLWILSDTAEHKANILGSGVIFLTGTQSGLKWAGLWL